MGGRCTTEILTDSTMGGTCAAENVNEPCAETPVLLKTKKTKSLLPKKGNDANEQNLDIGDFSSKEIIDGWGLWHKSSTDEPASIASDTDKQTPDRLPVNEANGVYTCVGGTPSVHPGVHWLSNTMPVSGTLTTSFGSSRSDSNAYVKLSLNGVEVHRVTGQGIEEHSMQVVAGDVLTFSKHGDTNIDIQSINLREAHELDPMKIIEELIHQHLKDDSNPLGSLIDINRRTRAEMKGKVPEQEKFDPNKDVLNKEEFETLVTTLYLIAASNDPETFPTENLDSMIQKRLWHKAMA